MKRSRLCIILICIIAVFGLSTAICCAADYTKYSTYKTGETTTALNVRSAASTSATVIKVVDKGTKFTLFGYKKSNGIKWYRVTYNGKAGYVSSSYVKQITTLSYTLYTPYKKGKVNASAVNVRKGPGTSYSKLGTAKKGDTYTIKGYRTVSGVKWYRITYSGKAGYISSQYVTLVSTTPVYVSYKECKTAKVGSDGAVIRKEASASASKYTTLKSGAKVAIYGEITVSNVKWYGVYYKGNKGYVKASAVSIVDNLSFIIYTPYKTGKVISDSECVYSGAGTTSTKYGTIARDTMITVKGYVMTQGEKWYRITYNGNAAYVKASGISITDYLSYELYTPLRTCTADKNLVVRKGPGTSYLPYGVIDSKSYITINGYILNSSGNKWYLITYNDRLAYISASDVTLESTISYIAYSPYRTGIVSGSVNARKEASVDSESLGKFSSGDQITIKGYKYDSDGEMWYRTIYDSKAAYIKAKYAATLASTTVSLSGDSMLYLTVDSSALNVRSGIGTDNSIIGTLSSGDTAEIVGKGLDSYSKTWYAIGYNGQIGYVHSGYVTVSEISEAESSSYEAYLIKEGFPESYRPYLIKLHAAHPDWVFKAQKTGLSWDEVVDKETDLGVNLYNGSYASFKSMAKGSYDFTNKTYVTFDSGGWVNAYSGLTKYYLDPRNYLNENYIYTFLDQSFDSSSQSISTVKSMVKGSFLDSSFPESTYKTYSSCIYYAAKAAEMNPNVLASMIIQEQGWNGQSSLISGTYSGYKGYYNYLNIGAYRTATMSAVERGLWYAKQMGWNTRAKAIKGGASWYATGYINNNQNTLYLKKFNVMNGASKVGIHQYMTNVEGAAGEGKHMKSAYENVSGTALLFSIPIYSSMPAAAVEKPTTSGNNNNLLDSLKVTGYTFSSSFARYTESYVVTVPSSVKSIKVTAAANDSGATVTGTGTITLNEGTNYIKVKCTSTSGLTRTYTITVKRN